MNLRRKEGMERQNEKGKRRLHSILLPWSHREELFGARGGLGSAFLDFFGLLALVPVVFALELLDPARRIDVLHFAGEERVARGANFRGDVFLRAARRELVAATAGDRRLFVFRMNVFFHGFCSKRKHEIYPNRHYNYTRQINKSLRCPMIGFLSCFHSFVLS
jgi:hypothetical protein